MKNHPLKSISPLDGRYFEKLIELTDYFSEHAIFKQRVFVELMWLKALGSEKKINDLKISGSQINLINNIIKSFNLKDSIEIKKIENKINHDVKAVEYWIKKKFEKESKLKDLKEFVHFACTSEDINNITYSLLIKDSIKKIILPNIESVLRLLKLKSIEYSDIPMISRTHGQIATPTTLGKELSNHHYRLSILLNDLSNKKYFSKINGAVGNYNAHYVAYPNVNWMSFSKNFVTKLNLSFNPYTTQIEPHDNLASIFANLNLINTVLVDFCRDIWGYISINYFSQVNNKDEVGSSTMPHKINPIDFENAEGNLGLANSYFNFFSNKLPISRWQRDLTDSTVLRNIGVAFGHSLLSYKSIQKGLKKIIPNKKQIDDDLEKSWEVMAEPIQIIMKKYRIPKAYEILKNLTRGNNKIDEKIIKSFVKDLPIPKKEKDLLLKISPKTYIGKAIDLAKKT